MGQFIDETGNKYGLLTVLNQAERRENSGGYRWICQCECGNITEVSGSHLRNGSIKSCGCLNKKKAINEIGNKYGKLTVLKKGKSKNHRAYWICQCDCGNIVEISGTNLRQGQTGCGCGQIQNRIGNRYGKLVVLKQLPNNMWECQCDCGNVVIANGKHLDKKHKMSCGCLKSLGEQKILQLLQKNNIKFEKEKIFSNCIYPDTKGYARFDFYLPDYNTLIEYDGEQHFISKNVGWSNNDQLKYTQSHDNFKNLWCQLNNYNLIRISYTEYDSISIETILTRCKEINK